MNEDLLHIDKYNLDVEWLNQPKLFAQYSAELAEAKQKRDRAYAETKVVSAEMYLAVRSNPEKHGLPTKPTEGMVNMQVQASKELKTANRKHRAAQHRFDVLSGFVDALNQRCKALENLVKLHGQSYFSRPVADSDLTEAMKDNTRRAARKTLKRSNRKTKE